uniref:Uncharacterized protein MANES_08G000300 n=1 Tax=Rhizophora mucronata TaxID=61149 RepID=A0A2P2JMT2_RHIMU
MFRAVALPFLSTGTVAAYLPRQSEKNTRTSKAKKRPSSKGFGADTKELQWRCVEGCGACCKLAKDATFTTPEEIFTDPKDVQVCLPFSMKYLVPCSHPSACFREKMLNFSSLNCMINNWV